MSPTDEILAALGPLPRAEDVLPRQSRTEILDAAETAWRLIGDGSPAEARAVLWRVLAVERLGREGAARLEAERARNPLTLAAYVARMPDRVAIESITLEADGRVVGDVALRQLGMRGDDVLAPGPEQRVAGHMVDYGAVERAPRSGRNLKRALASGGEAAVRKALGLVTEPLDVLRVRVRQLRDRMASGAEPGSAIEREHDEAVAELARMDGSLTATKGEILTERDLLRLGAAKPMGYMPISTIEREGFVPAEVVEKLQKDGRYAVIIAREVCHVGPSGALYACDPQSLARLLARNVALLSVHGWPLDPIDFMRRVAEQHVRQEEAPALYALIGQAFNDGRFPTPPGLDEA